MTPLRGRSVVRVAGTAWLVAVLLVLALALGLPVLVAVAAPFAVALAIGLALAATPEVAVAVTLDRERAVEGDRVTAHLAVRSPQPVHRVELTLSLPDAVATEGPARAALRLGAGGEAAAAIELRCLRWGAQRIGPVEVRAWDQMGLVAHRGWAAGGATLRVYPRPPRLRALLQPARTLVHTGNQLARQRGDGIEFSDLRAFVPGDRVRRINWRVTARRGAPFVTLRHPERNSDVILFLDSFRDARLGTEGTLDLAVRALTSLAAGHLGRRDRVGLIGFGGVLRWLKPGTGIGQLYRVVDAVLDTEVVLSYAWKDLDVLPRRMLPPAAMVVALTPLLDPRGIRAMLDLAARGYDLAIVEVDPERFAPAPRDRVEQLALRLWRLTRDARRRELRQAGIRVGTWARDEPLDPVLAGLLAARRPRWRVPA
ncbi:MAG TPA: DUF58 domain-containing protein [Candidatus Micrarchaeia archaeon]|nr:DUF58 domain-containing protein [Candidatus Micrarchaeia archaeon]